MTAASPAGVVEFPRQRWVQVSIYYRMSPTDGRIAIWQDGQRIMDLTAPTMNTFGGHSIDPLGNATADMVLQFGIYGERRTDGVQRIFVDDFVVTD